MQQGTHLWNASIGARVGLAIAGLALSALPAQASTFRQADVEELTRQNSTVMVGKVVDSFSYWNEDGTAILTDVTVQPESLLKGAKTQQGSTTLTLLGGEVDGLRQVIIGGAELELGESYVIFASQSDLPGAEKVQTLPDHSQGVFEISLGNDGELRAKSQARNIPLKPGKTGAKSAPGGLDGLDFNQLLQTVTSVVNSQKEGVGQ